MPLNGCFRFPRGFWLPAAERGGDLWIRWVTCETLTNTSRPTACSSAARCELFSVIHAWFWSSLTLHIHVELLHILGAGSQHGSAHDATHMQNQEEKKMEVMRCLRIIYYYLVILLTILSNFILARLVIVLCGVWLVCVSACTRTFYIPHSPIHDADKCIVHK